MTAVRLGLQARSHYVAQANDQHGTIYCHDNILSISAKNFLWYLLYTMQIISMLPQVFAEFLIDCRREHNYSQRKLASLIGCSRSYIAFLEDGTHLPTINTFMLLAHAFGMSPAELQAKLDMRLRAVA